MPHHKPHGGSIRFVVFVYCSLVFSLAAFALSFVYLRRTSLGMTIVIPILTILYHTAILIVHRRLHTQSDDCPHERHHLLGRPAVTAASVSAVILFWLVQFGLTVCGLLTTSGGSSFASNPVTVGLNSSEVGILAIVTSCARPRELTFFHF